MQNWPPSPYRPGNGIDPPYLGDREEQIEAVRAFLKDARNPRNVLITGLRGVGKTVLLNHLQGEAEGLGWLVVDREFSEPDADPRRVGGATARAAADAHALRAASGRRQPRALEELLGANVHDTGARQPSPTRRPRGPRRSRDAPGPPVRG